MKKRLCCAVSAGALMAFSAPVLAQSGAPAATAQDENSIGEILVVAQRREESLQKVPIAITAVSRDQLEAANITSSYDLVAAAPTLTINRSAVYAVPFLRGVGSSNIVLGDEPSVASYVDGFYQGPAASANLPFNNIDRVEVLKGPQGTLYGRNATGGLINLITSKPQERFAARGAIGYGNFDTFEADGYVTGPLSDRVRADLSLRFRDQGKGYVLNRFNGHRVGTSDVFSMRGKVEMDLGDNSTLTLAADYFNARDNMGTSQSNEPGVVPVGAASGGLYSDVPRETYLNIDSIGSVKAWGVSSTLRVDLGAASLVSLTQYRNYTSDNILDADATSADNLPASVFPGGVGRQNPAFYFDSPSDMPYFVTQELQLLSNGDGPFSWIVGGFGQLSEERYIPLQFFTNSDLAVPFVSIFAEGKTSSAAGFGQLSYDVGGGLKLTAGGRMTWERKAATGAQYAGAYNPATSLPSTVQDKAKSWTSFTYRLAADWQATDALMLYASASKGFKSGTFNTNTISPTSPPVDPETLYAYEVGFKADPGRTFRLNGAFYYYDYKNIQFYAQQVNVAALLNAAGAKLYGAEVDFVWRPVRGLTFNGGLAWEHSEYTDFPGAQVYMPYAPLPSGLPDYNAPLAFGQATYFLDAKGRPVVRTPEFTGNITATYDTDFADGSGMTLSANVYHNSGYSFDPLEIVNQKSYSLLGASLTYRLPGDKFSVMLWGKNLTNETYLESVTSGGRNSRVGYNPPRTYGVTLKMSI